jgi:hypothetical protein
MERRGLEQAPGGVVLLEGAFEIEVELARHVLSLYPPTVRRVPFEVFVFACRPGCP